MKINTHTPLLVLLFGTTLTLSSVSAKVGKSHHHVSPQKKKARHKTGTPVPLPLPIKLVDKSTSPDSTPPSKEKHDDSNARIVGGEEVTGPGVYPFFVSWDGSCGGALVHSDVIISAAHCFEIYSDEVTVNAYELYNTNTSGAEVRTITERLIHPDFNPLTIENDVMLLKLDIPVTSVEPIEINDDSSLPVVGQDLTVIGLGATREDGCPVDRLREVTVSAVSDQECNDAYAAEIGEDVIAEDVMMCAGVEGGGKDSCYGDSGGPIFTVTGAGDIDKLVGVVSWGYGCAQPGIPGVYTELSAYDDWILHGICALSDNPPENCPDPTPPPTPTPPGPDEAAVTINVVTDAYPYETWWELLDDKGELVEQGSYFLPNHSKDTFVNLKKGKTYFFDIFDFFGDGGPSYEVTTGSAALASGSLNDYVETTTFVIPGVDSTPALGDTRVDVLIMTDAYPLEIGWNLFDDQDNIVARAPHFSYSTEQNLYTMELNLFEGKEYLFNITDLAGDGLTSFGVEGYYEIKTLGGAVLAHGAEYDYFETSTFIVPAEGETSPTPTTDNASTTPPTLRPTDSTCEDTDGSIYVDREVGEETCSWLAINLDRYRYLCQFVDVAIVCPSTCDWCSLFGQELIEEEKPVKEVLVANGDSSGAASFWSWHQTAITATAMVLWHFL